MAYNATLGAPGAVNSTGDRAALYLKVFAGEVLATFEESNVMKALHTIRTISSGKSAQFIVTGAAHSRYHTPGESLLEPANLGNELGNEKVGSPATKYLSTVPHNERVISIDKLLTSSAFMDDLDAAMSQWDIRSTYAKEIGKELAKQFDINTINTVIGCSRAAATITGGKTGGAVTAATMATDADVLLDEIASAAQKLDENDVSDSDRYLILRPAQYWLLLNDSSATTRSHLVNRDFTAGNGDIAKGTLMQAFGFTIFKSNHIPTDVAITADSGGRADPGVSTTTGNDVYGSVGESSGYHGDTAKTVGLAFHKSAIGTVKLLDLSVQSDYLVSHQGSILVARYAMGHNYLRPEAAIELRTAAE